MIEIKPNIQHQSNCPYCGTAVNPLKVVWSGMQIYVESKCDSCQSEFIEALRFGHSVNRPYQYDLKKQVYLCPDDGVKEWLARPLIESLQSPLEAIQITKEVFQECKRVIVLNTIDNIYGHCLLKLLNAQRHLDRHPDYGLVVIVQPFKRWMVPDGVAEIWTVGISLRNGQGYYPNFHQFVSEQFQRFEQIYVSEAYSHPSQFDITRFTKIPKHNFGKQEVKITYIWREDRPWCNLLLTRVLRKLKFTKLALLLQNWKVRRLFKHLKSKLPSAEFTVAGLGKTTQFPGWIQDHRVENFQGDNDQKLCQVYSDSRLVIGMHGSSMLKPSAHAGMTISLMPRGRWGNVTTDILFQEPDPRLASYRYQYVPDETAIPEIASIAAWMILNYSNFVLDMTARSTPMKTPVAFLIFKRPDTTEKVFATIRQAKPPKLLVVADGPRPDKPGEAEKCAETRAIIDQVDWDCEVLKNYSEVNLGCKKRVSSGLDWVFNTVEEAIILEDDCLPHPTFFRFCEQLLDYYRNDQRIMAISGDNSRRAGQKRNEYSYYFSRLTPIWGWASWRRAWNYYDVNMKLWYDDSEGQLASGYPETAPQVVKAWENTFQEVYEGKIDTWDYQWTFANWIQSGINIIANVNLISNCGFSEEATHTKDSQHPRANMSVEEMQFPLNHPPFMICDYQLEQLAWKQDHPSRLERLERKLKKIFQRKS